MSKVYTDKLKDPRWQKKRLEIFDRDNWTCRICSDKKDSLHVHHKRYISGLNPWEYDDKLLLTVCETCHIVIEDAKKRKDLFNLNKVKACCISDDDGAVTFYRYDHNQPLIVIKRGSAILPTKDAARQLIELLKRGLE